MGQEPSAKPGDLGGFFRPIVLQGLIDLFAIPEICLLLEKQIRDDCLGLPLRKGCEPLDSEIKPRSMTVTLRVHWLTARRIVESVCQVKHRRGVFQSSLNIGDQICRQVKVERFVREEAQGAAQAVGGLIQKFGIQNPPIGLAFELIFQQERFLAFAAAAEAQIPRISYRAEGGKDLLRKIVGACHFTRGQWPEDGCCSWGCKFMCRLYDVAGLENGLYPLQIFFCIDFDRVKRRLFHVNIDSVFQQPQLLQPFRSLQL